MRLLSRTLFLEILSSAALGCILGTIGVARILTWQLVGWYNYGPHYGLVALTVGSALLGVVSLPFSVP